MSPGRLPRGCPWAGVETAAVSDLRNAPATLAKIAAAKAPFVSRGDDSGPGYREAGSGMGATLNTTAGINAYTLVDRGRHGSLKTPPATRIATADRAPFATERRGVIFLAGGHLGRVGAPSGTGAALGSWRP